MVLPALSVPTLLSAGKSALGTLGASALSGLGSKISSFFGGSSKANSAKSSYLYSRALMEHQYELERQSRQTAYQDTRYSLEQAGYNPMLAVGQQSGSLPVGSQMTVTDPKIERMQAGLQASSAIADMQLKMAQARNLDADTENKPYETPLKVLGNLIGHSPDEVRKTVEGKILGSGFSANHPTTMRILQKLKNGDFRGVAYEIRSRTARKKANSAKSFGSLVDYANSQDFSFGPRKDTYPYKKRPPSNRPPSYIPY